MLRSIACEIRKCVFNIKFVFCVFAMLVLAFAGLIYQDMSSGEKVTVLEGIFSLSDSFIMQKPELSAFKISTGFCTSLAYSEMFFCIIVSVCFASILCDERKSGSLRYSLLREGTLKYCVSKLVSAMVSGALIMVLGQLVFSAIIYCFYPPLSDYDPSLIEGNPAFYLINNYNIDFLKTLAARALLGAYSVLPAFFFASFIKSTYVVVCLPFMTVFLQRTALNILILNDVEYKQGLLIKLLWNTSIGNISVLIFNFDRGVMAAALGLPLICFLALYLGVKGRCDHAQ